MKVSIVRVAAVVLVLCSCLVPHASRPASAADAGAPVTAAFEGKNFVFDSSSQAREGLRERLYDELDRKLQDHGFRKADIGNILLGARFSDMEVNEKRVQIAEGGGTKTVTAYDLSGKAEVRLGTADVQKLFQALQDLQPVSDADVTRFRGHLRLFAALSPPQQQLENLREKLTRAWLDQAKAALGGALSGRAVPADAFARAFSDVYPVVRAFREETGNTAGADQLTGLAESLVKKYFQAAAVDSSRAESVLDAVSAMEKEAGADNPQLGAKVRDVVQFRWREQINEMAGSEAVPLERLAIEVDGFARLFKGSKLVVETARRLEQRLAKAISSGDPGGGAAFSAYAERYVDFAKRFPSSASAAEVKRVFSSACARVMPELEAKNDEEYAAYTKCWEACFDASKGRPEYEKLKTAQASFLAANKARNERDLLGGLGFILYWDKAAADLGFGGQKGSFPGSGKGADMWDSGEDAPQCVCRPSPNDPCRQIMFSGEYYEAAAKFGPKGLYEVELCNFQMPQARRTFIYQALRDRHKPLHKKPDAEKFINGLSGDDVEFAATGGKRHRVALGAAGEKGSVRFFAPGFAPPESRPAVKETPAERRPARPFKKGDCVRWDCDVECRYEGKVKDRKGAKLMVTVKKAPRSLELDMNVLKDPDEMQTCED
ncbi:MAG: hypothetical protein HY897_13050 [Deltaproteobacteria bacterium]|nr:hypothetical protein [Deltaproteobacteria bacterium]